MDIESKCDIIEEFMREHILNDKFKDEDVDEFLEYNDLGIPLAQGVAYDLAELTDEGETLVEETWNGLCKLFSADPYGEYDGLDDLFGLL